MKTLKFPLLLCLLALVATGFSACSDDDDEKDKDSGGDVNVQLLVGTWQQTISSGWEKEDGEIIDEWNYNSDDQQRFSLNRDKSCDVYELDSNDKWEHSGSGKWRYADGYLEMYDIVENGSRQEATKGRVVSLSENKLVWEIYEKDTDYGITYEYYDVITYTRVE